MRESDWLTKAAAKFGARHPGVPVGIGDDCAVLEPQGPLLLSTDTVVDGVHLDRGIMSFADMGWRALAVALSDLAACGADPARPISALISAQFSPDLTDDQIMQFAEGLLACAQAYDCAIAGGDTVSTPGPFAVSVTVAGFADQPALRSGAGDGELIAVTGPVGQAAAGLYSLRLRLTDERCADCRNAFRRPVPLLNVGFALAAFASAMIDISDGLLVDLDHICQASGVGAKIDWEKIPVTDAAKDILNQAGLDPLPAAITFGDDYQLLCCLPPAKWAAAQKVAPGLTAIGVIEQGDKALVLRNGQPIELARRGYEHGLPDENNAKEKT